MEKNTPKEVKINPFGKTKTGAGVSEFVITNKQDITISLLSWGATLRSVQMPDRTGQVAEITLGFDYLKDYMGNHPYIGATIGRFANRIANSSFSIDGQDYKLAHNEKNNHLHGGKKGFNKIIWQADPFQDEKGSGVQFSYLSRDGEEGYPGNLRVSVIYRLTDANELIIEYQAETDKKTPVNLTNHAYWNLGGAGCGPIFDHVLKLNASRYLPIDKALIPTGEIASVKNTPFDFTTPKPIGQDFKQGPRGYDHCFVIDRTVAIQSLVTPVAEICDPQSGRGMRIYTTQTGIQLYTSNMLKTTHGANKKTFKKYGAFCLETESFPDAVHKQNFPSPFLAPGEKYYEKTVHQFFHC